MVEHCNVCATAPDPGVLRLDAAFQGLLATATLGFALLGGFRHCVVSFDFDIWLRRHLNDAAHF